MQLKYFPEQVFFTTVRISASTSSGEGSSIGTGFLYSVQISRDKSCILLVSNRHVYNDPANPIQLIFHRSDGLNPDRPLLGQTVSLKENVFESVFTGHPDPAVDLACINISMIGHTKSPIFIKTVADQALQNFDDDNLLPGNEVWFVGYPENRFDTKNNLPILRKGTIASIPKINFENKPEFLIDAQVFPGSSGSPVFTSNGNQVRLIGVLSAGMIKKAEVENATSGMSLKVIQTLGLGIVLKSSLLNQLFDAATHKIRAELEANEKNPAV